MLPSPYRIQLLTLTQSNGPTEREKGEIINGKILHSRLRLVLLKQTFLLVYFLFPQRMRHYKTFLQQFKYRNKHTTLDIFNGNFNHMYKSIKLQYPTLKTITNILITTSEYTIIFIVKRQSFVNYYSLMCNLVLDWRI